MNLDTLSFFNKIHKAVTQVKSPSTEGTWMLLGYVDTCRKSSVMSIDVVREGSIWIDLLESFEDDKIQFGFAKLEFEGNSKLFLIHWVGKDVEENLKISCMPHLNEIRNLIPTYDLLVNSMDQQDIQSKVHSYLTRTQTICVEKQLTMSWRHSALSKSPEQKEGREKSSKRSYSFKANSRHRTFTGYKEDLRKSRVEETSSFTSFITLSGNKPKVKIAIVGSSNVGKTSIYVSYNGGGCSLQNPHGLRPTISADFMSRDVIVGKHNFTLEIWDTAGQERFASFASFYTRNAKVVICVYDISENESFKEISKHMQAAKEHADPRAIFILVGNKADLVYRREVRQVDAEKFAARHGMIFMECSGLTGLNILKLFESITKHVVFTYQDIFEFPDATSKDTIRLTDNPWHSKGGCQRCNK